MKTYNVFVYGTLRSDQCNHHVASPYILRKSLGQIYGKIFNVGAYPALILEGKKKVLGEWLTVSEEGLQAMNVLEGFEEGRLTNYYDRVWIRDLVKPIEGYVYVYNPEKVKDLELIKSGCWVSYQENKE